MELALKDISYEISGNSIIYELLENELIVANLNVGIFYSIKECGIPIWQLLMAGVSMNSIQKMFKEHYGIEASQSILSFVNTLLTENLLTEVAGEEPKELSAIFWPQAYKEPAFDKYEDMKNLLMIDPIHEVDEKGWPSKFQ